MEDWEEQRPIWQPIAAMAAIAVMLYYAYVLERRVPLLGSADLGFHELGHMLTRPFGETFSFIMGSGTQVLIPVSLATYFWLTRRDPQAAFLLGWAATSMQDVSVYIADAPFERLQLIGGDHDWAFLLSKWGMIDRADTLAGIVWVLGLAAGIAGLIVAATPFIQKAVALLRNRRDQLAAPVTVREARPTQAQTD